MEPSSSDPPHRSTYSLSSASRSLRSEVSTTEGLFQSAQLAGFPPHLELNPSAVATGASNSTSGLSSSNPFLSSYHPPFSPVAPVFYSPPESAALQNVFGTPQTTRTLRQRRQRQITSVPASTAPLQRPLPSLVLSPAPVPTSLQFPFLPSSNAATMSAVAALQFDPVFGMGSRASYSSWPVIDSNNGLLGHDLASYGSDTSLSPPSASRSVTASPPRRSITLTAQQRELKRQREQIRREVKVASRRRVESFSVPGINLSTSSSTPTSSPGPSESIGPSTVVDISVTASTSSSVPIQTPTVTAAPSSSSFLQSPPVAMADLSASSSAGGLPGPYTTSAPSHISLLSEPVTTSTGSLSSPAYMSTGGGYSPSMQDQANQGVFSSSYQGQTYLSEYGATSFSSAAPSALHSQYQRGTMHDQPNLMYQMPPQQSPMMGGTGSIQHQHQAPPHHAPLPPPSYGSRGMPIAEPPHMPIPHARSSHAYDAAVGVGSGVAAGPSGVRVVQSRPKPQCWEHGCNGRQFSTFSNLLRHQREKSGQAAKAVCPNCGAEFTRTTARNGHLQHDKCKQRRNA